MLLDRSRDGVNEPPSLMLNGHVPAESHLGAIFFKYTRILEALAQPTYSIPTSVPYWLQSPPAWAPIRTNHGEVHTLRN